jgi:hypothetical protein
MVDVFNELGVDVATPGNHDFDFGVDALVGAIGRSKFPWVLVSSCQATIPPPPTTTHANTNIHCTERAHKHTTCTLKHITDTRSLQIWNRCRRPT